MRKLRAETIIGSVWTAFWIVIMVWITIYDYPRDVDVYAGWIHDASWYWHEIGLVFGIWIAGMLWLMIVAFWRTLSLFVSELKGFGMLPDGRIIFIRKKKD